MGGQGAVPGVVGRAAGRGEDGRRVGPVQEGVEYDGKQRRPRAYERTRRERNCQRVGSPGTEGRCGPEGRAG